MSEVTQFEPLIQRLLDKKDELGVTAAEVQVGIDRGFSVNVRMGKTESIEQCIDKSASIKVYIDQRSGVTTTSDLTQEALNLAFEKAAYIAKLTSEDPFSGLPEKERLAFDYPDLDLYHPWDFSVHDAVEAAIEAEKVGLSFNPLITNSDGVDVTSYTYDSFYANTLGFVGAYSTTNHSLSCSLLASKGEDMQRDSDYTVARDPQDLADFKKIAQSAADKAVSRLNAKPLPMTGKIPVLFSPRMAKGLLQNFLSAIRGGNLYRKNSFLLNALGKKVFPDFIQMDQNPHLLKGIGSAPFDSEGTVNSPCFFVRDGVLENYILSTYSAKRLKMEPNGTSGGPYNLKVHPGKEDFKGLLKQMGKGLFVTEMMGHGVNLTNGDYSRGAFGFWVENGEIQHPVSGITVAGNLKEIFLNVLAIGNDLDARGNVQVGSMLVDGLTVVGEV